jgi:hypothetical protein
MKKCIQCGTRIINNDSLICEKCSIKIENRSVGLGDTIEKFTHATGLDKIAKSIASALGYEDCGCTERKRLANEKFPYIWPKYKK